MKSIMQPTKLLAAWMAAAVALAQAAPESGAVTLERGAYLEATVGDLKGAEAIYRQLISDSSRDMKTRSQAGLRLVQLSLSSGNLREAAAASQLVVRALGANNVALPVLTVPNPSEPQRSQQPLGKLEGLHYTHFASKVEFDLPAGWSLVEELREWGGEAVKIAGPGMEAKIWIQVQENDADMIRQVVDTAVGAGLRRMLDTGQRGTLRWDDTKKEVITGHHAISYLADLTETNQKEPRVQYMVDIAAPHTVVKMEARAAISKLDALRSTVDTLLWGARIP